MYKKHGNNSQSLYMDINQKKKIASNIYSENIYFNYQTSKHISIKK